MKILNFYYFVACIVPKRGLGLAKRWIDEARRDWDFNKRGTL